MGYLPFWEAISAGGEWDEVLEGIKQYAGGDKKKIANLNRQKNRVRSYFAGRNRERRSGARTAWIHDVVALRLAEYAGIDPDDAYLLFHSSPPAGYELRGYLSSLAEVGEYIQVIPSEYVAIIPTRNGWAVYVVG